MRSLWLLHVGVLLVGCANTDTNTENGSRAPVRDASVVSVQGASPELVLVEDQQPEKSVGAQQYESASAEVGRGAVVQTDSASPKTEVLQGSDAKISEIESASSAVAANADSDGAEQGVQQVDADVVDNAAPALDTAQSTKPTQYPDPAQRSQTNEPQTSKQEDVGGVVQVPLIDPIVEVAEEVDESEVVAYLLDEAEQSLRDDNLSKARGQAERAVTLEPTAGRGYLILAEIALQEDDPEAAAEAVRQGLASVSDSDEVFQRLNQVLGRISEIKSSRDPDS